MNPFSNMGGISDIANQIPALGTTLARISADDLLVAISQYTGTEPPTTAVSQILRSICSQTAAPNIHDAIVNYTYNNLLDTYLNVLTQKQDVLFDLLLGNQLRIPPEPSDSASAVEPTDSASAVEPTDSADAGASADANAGASDDIRKPIPAAGAGEGDEPEDKMPSLIKEAIEGITAIIIKTIENDKYVDPVVKVEKAGEETLLFTSLMQNSLDRLTKTIGDKKNRGRNLDLVVKHMDPLFTACRNETYKLSKQLIVDHLNTLTMVILQNIGAVDESTQAARNILNDAYLHKLFQLYYVEYNHRGPEAKMSEEILEYISQFQPDVASQLKTKVSELKDASNIVGDFVRHYSPDEVLVAFKSTILPEEKEAASTGLFDRLKSFLPTASRGGKRKSKHATRRTYTASSRHTRRKKRRV
jgi:hypothetical protein